MRAALRSWLQSVRRLVWILWVLARHGWAHWAGAGARPGAAPMTPPERLRVIFEEVGGTFVKFGQMLALQPDLIPRQVSDALYDLLDRIEPFSYGQVECIFQEELGASPQELFDRFHRIPLATASVGQVHVAWLDGRKLAVKVQRPRAAELFRSDIRLMEGVLGLIRWLRLKPLFWLLEPLTEFVAWTEEELDFRVEARYAERLGVLARGQRVQRVPRVHGQFTRRRILVVDFLPGVTLLDYLRARQAQGEDAALTSMPDGFEPQLFASHVIDNFLNDAFRHGLYHADLHPANLMILEGGVVGYIDFGITGAMSPHARRHLVAMTLALAEGDMDRLYQDFLRVSAYGRGADLEAFRGGLEELAQGWYEAGPRGRSLRVNFTRIMGEMLTLSRRTGVLPERDIVKYIRSAIAIDGLITRFAPGFDVGAYLADACARHILWQQREAHWQPGAWLDWLYASRRLLEKGPERYLEWLERLGRADLVGTPVGLPQRRARRLVVGLLLTVTLLVVDARPWAWGWSPRSAELLLVLSAALMLTVALREGTV